MREWTEKHIRELIDNQLKKLEGGGTEESGVIGAYTGLDGYAIQTAPYFFIDTEFNNDLLLEPGFEYPDTYESAQQGRICEYEYKTLVSKQEYETGIGRDTLYTSDGRQVFGILTNTALANTPVLPVKYYGAFPLNEHAIPILASENTYGTEGIKRLGLYQKLYPNSFAYQDGKYFLLVADELTENRTGYVVNSSGTRFYLSGCVILRIIQPSEIFITSETMEAHGKYFSSWLNFDFTKPRYVYTNVRYLTEKEV